MAMHYDLVVLGCGPAGEKAAAQAAYFGKRVAIVEHSPTIGGAAANTGIPLKALRETALFLDNFRRRGLPGVEVTLAMDTSLRELLAHEHPVVRGLRSGVAHNLDVHRVDLIPGAGTFVDPHTIEVTHPTRQTQRLTGDIILIATGSRPVRPSHFPMDEEGIYDSNTMLRIFDMPKAVAIAGGGAIGCEYAAVLALLGCRSFVIDSHEAFLPFLDSEVAVTLRQSLIERGVEFISPVRVTGITPGKPIQVDLEGRHPLMVDAVLVAVGRVGNTEGLGLDRAGVTTNARGLVEVNGKYQTGQPHIFAAGDVIGFPSLQSTSMEQGRMAMVNAFDLKYKEHIIDLLPFGLYTVPECSMVGETEASARRKGIHYVIGRASYRNNVRGTLIGDDVGFLKLLFRADDMRLIGAHMLGAEAIELINIAVVTMQQSGTHQTFIDACFNFPSLADLYKYATYDAMQRQQQGRIIHPEKCASLD